MLRKGHSGLYKAPKKEARRKRKAKRRIRSDKFTDLRFEKMTSCRIRERKKKARRSINCMFLGWMMICGIEFEIKEYLALIRLSINCE